LSAFYPEGIKKGGMPPPSKLTRNCNLNNGVKITIPTDTATLAGVNGGESDMCAEIAIFRAAPGMHRQPGRRHHVLPDIAKKQRHRLWRLRLRFHFI